MRIRFFSRLLKAFLTKYYLPVFLGAFLGSASFFLAPKFLPVIPKFRDTYIIAQVGRYSLLDLPLSLQSKISLGLTTLTPDGMPAAGLAKSWSIDESGKVYTFELAPNIKWQDGTPIKSKDITYHFKDLEVSYPDSSHLVMKLKEPFSPLPLVLSKPVFKSGLLGAGSYKVNRVKKTGQIIESILLSPIDQSSRLSKIKYYFYPSEQQARLAFKLGTANAVEDIQELSDLEDWPSTEVSSYVQKDRYIGVFFNTQSPDFSGQSGKSLRQALAYAIDKSRWTNRAISPISPTSWAYNGDVKKYDYDLTRAKQLLDKVEKVPQKVTISVLPLYLSTAENIKSDWDILGVPTQIQVVPEVPIDFSILIIAQAIPLDPDQYNLWHSTQSTNITHFNRPRADKLLEDGRKTIDTTSRKTIYAELQKFITEEVPVIFLYHPTTYTITRN